MLFGAQNAWDLPVALWALLVQWAGIYAITSYRERSRSSAAGLVVGRAGALVALAVETIAHTRQPFAHSVRRGPGVLRAGRSGWASSSRSCFRCSRGSSAS